MLGLSDTVVTDNGRDNLKPLQLKRLVLTKTNCLSDIPIGAVIRSLSRLPMKLFSSLALILFFLPIEDRSHAQSQDIAVGIPALSSLGSPVLEAIDLRSSSSTSQGEGEAKPDDLSGVDSSFRGMAIRDHREAWIAGSKGMVIRTTDSGNTWQRIIVPDTNELDFRDVELLRDGSVILMSAGEGNASRLFRSIDDGKTWRTVLANSDPKGFFDGMAFRKDGRHGVLYGDPIDGRLDIYLTADGGKAWKRLPFQQHPKLMEGEYGFAASGTGIVTKGTNIWIATGGSVARVWHSQDSGRTWQPYDSNLRGGNPTSGIFSIDFLDQQSAVAIGGNYAEPDLDQGNVAVSSDGGRTWSSMHNTRMPHKACVQSLGGGRFLTCGRTGVAFTKDAGRTWETITTDGYYTLRANIRSGIGFLAGSDGRVARFRFAPVNGQPLNNNGK